MNLPFISLLLFLEWNVKSGFSSSLYCCRAVLLLCRYLGFLASLAGEATALPCLCCLCFFLCLQLPVTELCRWEEGLPTDSGEAGALCCLQKGWQGSS